MLHRTMNNKQMARNTNFVHLHGAFDDLVRIITLEQRVVVIKIRSEHTELTRSYISRTMKM